MAFQQLETRLEGPVLLAPDVHGDDRGFLVETFTQDGLAEVGIADEFVQDNHSRSGRSVLRGIHFKVGGGMAKLVRCARGAIVDVVVDLRTDSPTFSEWEAFELDDAGHHQLYIPIGFGHGFCVVSEVADVLYRCTGYYEPELERAVAWDDPAVGIEWPESSPILSERDRSAPRLADIQAELPFRCP
ncbi:MAG: dTDP-4-dehydrorhamnose 3,5-epimerase [Thermoleophilaceae bacterium]|nr:dTDP-4-dehydrorhamnose 3,5-epimerase [Thermoleophilaceae bacterium]